MREILYEYHNRGVYVSYDNTHFDDDKQLKIIVKPHQFSIGIGDEILRSSSCDGYEVIVSNEGETAFYDNKGNLVVKTEKTEISYKEVRIDWFKNSILAIQFGAMEVIDHYPNCDGEYDRYSVVWTPKYSVELNTKDNSIKII